MLTITRPSILLCRDLARYAGNASAPNLHKTASSAHLGSRGKTSWQKLKRALDPRLNFGRKEAVPHHEFTPEQTIFTAYYQKVGPK
jgi:hypothetical protein